MWPHTAIREGPGVGRLEKKGPLWNTEGTRFLPTDDGRLRMADDKGVWRGDAHTAYGWD